MILDIIYSRDCIICGKPDSKNNLCQKCMSEINILSSEVTARIQNYYSRIFAIAAYDGALLELIHRFKYVKSRSAVRIIEDIVQNHTNGFKDVDCVVPVPLSWRRYLKRNYNQSFIIARTVSRAIGKPLYGRALKKVKSTPPQVGKALEERKTNLKGSFSIPRLFPQSIRGKRVLLVDDVVTSGATVDECSHVLKTAGALNIDVLTLAKTL